ncbi:hypothetical protein LINPERHAP2_LOCUS40987, partial [Linum perenne]
FYNFNLLLPFPSFLANLHSHSSSSANRILTHKAKRNQIVLHRNMAGSLQRLSGVGCRSIRSALPSLSRQFSSDALVEAKPGEIGMVSGIPTEHLRRRVIHLLPPRLFSLDSGI